MVNMVWVNGELVDADSAVVDALGAGVTSGLGVFESMKVVDGVAFARSRHLTRLANSANIVGLDIPERTVLLGALSEVIESSPQITRVRITVLAGRSLEAPVTVVVHGERQGAWPPVAHAVTSPFVRNERGPLTGAKPTAYADNLIARREALARGADEALLFDTRGFLSEGTASNVFIEVDGRLCTPALSNGCLAGVTAELVCEIVDVDVRGDLTPEHLARTTEAFLTSSTRDVHPLASIDGRALPHAPGPLTRAAAAAFTDLQVRTDDP